MDDQEGIHTEEEAEKVRASFLSRSIGPHGSGLILVSEMGYAAPFFKVQWTQALSAVQKRVANGDEIDVHTRWALMRVRTLEVVLEVEWPELNVDAVLFFNDGKWWEELSLVVSNGGEMLFAPEDAPPEKDAEKLLDRCIGINAPTDLLVYAFHLRGITP